MILIIVVIVVFIVIVSLGFVRNGIAFNHIHNSQGEADALSVDDAATQQRHHSQTKTR